MALFGLLTKPKPEINAGVEACARTPDAVLLDVRTREEYAAAIGGSRRRWGCPPPRRSCRTGARRCTSTAAAAAADALRRCWKRMGYTNVTDIGGIADYRGRVVR